MKKYVYTFVLLFLALNITFFSNAQNTYFREGFFESAWPSTAAAAAPVLGTGVYVSASSGTWYTYGAYSTNGSTGACVTQTGDVLHCRMGNLNSVTGTSGTDSAFFVTPIVNFGVNTITFYNGRAARRFTIFKTTDTSATTTNWTSVTLVPATNAACDFITVTISDVTAKRIKVMSRAGTDSDLDSLTMTSVNAITPVKFGAVNASLSNGLAKISWDVISEINTANYYIEKSDDGKNFAALGSLTATNAPKYSFVDNAPASSFSYYRIKAVDKDGTVGYSNTVKLNNKKADATIAITPNPVVNGTLNLQLNNFSKAAYTVALYDFTGKQVYVKTMNIDNGTSSQAIDLPTSVTKGIYQLQVTNGNVKLNKSVIIQ